jgi:hypothetical protein
VLAASIVTHHWAVGFVPNCFVYAHRLVVFPFDTFGNAAAVQSTIHELWAREYSSQLETRLNYSASDCLETFAFPTSITTLDEPGRRYFVHRASVTVDRGEGFTAIYNRFHKPSERSTDIQQLREFHVELDSSVAKSYGWTDLDLDHNFHDRKQGIGFTINPTARQEILDRLLELNHQRYAEEVAQGLHEKRSAKGKVRATSTRGKRKVPSSPLLEGA